MDYIHIFDLSLFDWGVILEVKFTATVSSKSIVNFPQGVRRIKIELVEEHDLPPPVFYSSGDSEMAREVLPIVKQVLRIMPVQPPRSVSLPRLTVWLSEDEWEALDPKPEVGETITVVISSSKIKIDKSSKSK